MEAKQLAYTDEKISVLTMATDVKVAPAKYEAGFKKVNSKSAKLVVSQKNSTKKLGS